MPEGLDEDDCAFLKQREDEREARERERREAEEQELAAFAKAREDSVIKEAATTISIPPPIAAPVAEQDDWPVIRVKKKRKVADKEEASNDVKAPSGLSLFAAYDDSDDDDDS